MDGCDESRELFIVVSLVPPGDHNDAMNTTTLMINNGVDHDTDEDNDAEDNDYDDAGGDYDAEG